MELNFEVNWTLEIELLIQLNGHMFSYLFLLNVYLKKVMLATHMNTINQ